MKFKELLQKVSFDDIAPQLERLLRDIEFEPNKIRQIIQTRKKSYDILQQMQPEETDKPVRFYMDYYDAEHYGEKPRVKMDLYEDDFESCPWPLNLGKEIVLDEGVELSDAEIAARCLFHITFYGFTPEKVEQTLSRIARRAEKVRKKLSQCDE